MSDANDDKGKVRSDRDVTSVDIGAVSALTRMESFVTKNPAMLRAPVTGHAASTSFPLRPNLDVNRFVNESVFKASDDVNFKVVSKAPKSGPNMGKLFFGRTASDKSLPFTKSRAISDAASTGLVYARADSIDRKVMRKGTVRSPGLLKAPTKMSSRSTLKRGATLVDQISNASLRGRVDHALAKAADLGYIGDDAYNYVIGRVPEARNVVSVASEGDGGLILRQEPIGTGSKKQLKALKDVEIDLSKVDEAVGKGLRNVVKVLPVVSAVADAKELYDEIFNEEDPSLREIGGAALDLALGVTGVGGVLGDVFAFSQGADGLGSWLVGDDD